ncbi:MAG: toprim domain-containing protein [Halobacteriota archaeon]
MYLAVKLDDYETYMELTRVIHEMEMDEFVDAVIVEGVHDKAALREMGVTKEIAMCSSGPYSYAGFVDYLTGRYRRITILTDYDRAGKRLNKKLTTRLEREGVKVEKRYRDKIGMILVLRGFHEIESMTPLKRRASAWLKTYEFFLHLRDPR